MKHPIRMAILDMNNNHDNMGIASIKRIADRFAIIEYEVFDVRHKKEIPGFDFDIYISSGGPGDPLEMDGGWETEYYDLMDRLWQHNKINEEKKFAFFICHSFQMICRHFGIGMVTKREKESFGIVPVDITDAGRNEPLFKNLHDPFYGADFRKYQVMTPADERIKTLGATIVAMENSLTEMDKEKALMAIRFSNEWFGTQFHPEAHPDGMIHYLRRKEKKDMILEQYGLNSYEEMMHNAIHPDRLANTKDHVLPGFIENALDKIMDYSRPTPMVYN